MCWNEGWKFENAHGPTNKQIKILSKEHCMISKMNKFLCFRSSNLWCFVWTRHEKKIEASLQKKSKELTMVTCTYCFFFVSCVSFVVVELSEEIIPQYHTGGRWSLCEDGAWNARRPCCSYCKNQGCQISWCSPKQEHLQVKLMYLYWQRESRKTRSH